MMEDAQRRAIEKALMEEKAKEDDGNSDMGFSSAYNKFEQFKPAAPTTTPTGMTPNAVSPTGQAYSSWGARTGDWGAMQGPAAAETTPAMAEMGTTVAPAAAEVSPAVAEIAPEAGASLGYVGGAIVAAIAAQHMMSGATDRRTDAKGNASQASGHRTGDVFSGNFFTEPWMAKGEQALGVKTPTAGEKTDASIDRFREGKGSAMDVAKTAPETAAQWFDPVGAFAGNVVEDKFGKVGTAIMTSLMPHMALQTAGKEIGKLLK